MIAEQGAARTLKHAALKRLILPKNRAKGSWSGLTRLELIQLAHKEILEAMEAHGEGQEREEEELGDAAAFIAMALHVGNPAYGVPPAACCCAGSSSDDHDVCCAGWFWNEEREHVERCDECAIFEMFARSGREGWDSYGDQLAA